VKDKAKVAVDH